MGEDRSRKRAFTRQRCKRTVFNERFHTNNRVMTPVVRLTQLPEVKSGGKQRAINAGSKLLAARVQGVHTRRFRRRLDNPGIRVRFHQAYQTGQTVSAHHGISVQHHHIAVLVAPATAEVINVTAFTLHTTTTTTVENLSFALHFGNQLHPRLLFRNADIRIVAVTQNVNIEMLRIPRGFN